MEWKDSKYKKLIRITEEDLDWIKENKGKKSGAGFLEEIIKNSKKK